MTISRQGFAGRGKLFASEEATGLHVAYEYVVESNLERVGLPPSKKITGKIISNDSATLGKWYRDQTRLILETDTRKLPIYLTDPDGSFRGAGAPTPLPAR